ncbi:MAG: DUF362 domain-containing protein [bacterium]|nr:DUF362 domain-containing protein [bacterium]
MKKQKKINRREFIKKTAKYTATIYATISNPLSLMAFTAQDREKKEPILIVAKNSYPADLVKNAIKVMGGMSRFVKRGDMVVLKPNFSFDNPPEYASTTHPDLIYEVISMCYKAGARKVKVIDRTCYARNRCLEISGIRKAVEEANGEITYLSSKRFIEVKLHRAKDLEKISIYKDVLTADCLINMPIAKHHAITELTLGIKNWMGVIGGDRGRLIHPNIHQKLADICTVLKPNLVIMDATRILLRNGPSGGDLKDVKNLRTIVVGTDQVAVDSYATTFFGKIGREIEYIKNAYLMGLGEIDIKKMRIIKLDLKG